MPVMKLSRDEFDPKELDVEVQPRQFERYKGEVPKTDTELNARVTKAWLTDAKDGTTMIVLMLIAEGNTGKLAQYNGLPTREYLVFKPEGAFRYKPFLNHFGITLNDIANKLNVEDEDDNIGTPIRKIGKWTVGSNAARCKFVVVRERYVPNGTDEGEWRSKVDVDGWLPWDGGASDDEDDADNAPPTTGSARPRGRGTSTRSRSRRAPEPEPEEVYDEDEDDEDQDLEDEDLEDEDQDEEQDEDDEEAEEDEAEDEDDEEQEEEERPARGRRATASNGRGSRAKPTAAAGNGSSGRGRAAGSRTRSADTGRVRAGRTSSRSRRGSSGDSEGYNDEPPF